MGVVHIGFSVPISLVDTPNNRLSIQPPLSSYWSRNILFGVQLLISDIWDDLHMEFYDIRLKLFV